MASQFAIAELDHDGPAGVKIKGRSKYGGAPNQSAVKKSKAESILGPSDGVGINPKPSRWWFSAGASMLFKKSSAVSLAFQEFCTSLSLSPRRSRRAEAPARGMNPIEPGPLISHLGQARRPHASVIQRQRYDDDEGRAQSMPASTGRPSTRAVNGRRSKTFTGLMRTMSRAKSGREVPRSSGSTMESVSSMSITSADDILHRKPQWTSGIFARDSAVPSIPRSEKFYENQSYRSPERRNAKAKVEKVGAQPARPRPRNLAQVEEENTEASPASSSDSIRTLTSANAATTAPEMGQTVSTRAKTSARHQLTGRSRQLENKTSIYRPSALRSTSGVANQMTSNDLQVASVLSLSSSDDEFDTDHRPVNVFRPGVSPIQASAPMDLPQHKVPQRSKSSRAHTPAPRPSPRHAHTRPIPTRKTSVSFDPSLSETIVPESKRPSPMKRHAPDGKSHDPPAFLIENSVFSTKASIIDPNQTIPPSSRPSSTTRFVAVTKEEEALIESMRKKRAMLQSAATAAAPPSQVLGPAPAQATARPKTADANSEPRNSWLIEDETWAPFPSMPNVGTPNRRHSPGPSLSQIELRIAEDLPFLERASVLQALNGFRGGLEALTVGSERDSKRESESTLTPTVVHAYSSLEEKSGSFAGEHARVVKEADEKAELILTQWAMETESKLRQMSP